MGSRGTRHNDLSHIYCESTSGGGAKALLSLNQTFRLSRQPQSCLRILELDGVVGMIQTGGHCKP